MSKEFGQGDLLKCAHADDLERLVKTLAEFQLSPGNRDQQVRTDRRPYLAADRVFGATVKISDAQMLLDPFEEQFDLPPAFIEIADDLRSNAKIVREKDQETVLVVILEPDTS